MKPKKLFGIFIFVAVCFTLMKSHANDLTHREESLMLSEFYGSCTDTWCEMLSEDFEFQSFVCSFEWEECALEWSVSFSIERNGKTAGGSVAHTCILEIPSKEKLFNEGQMSHFTIKEWHRCFHKILDPILRGDF